MIKARERTMPTELREGAVVQQYYILKGTTPVQELDAEKYKKWREAHPPLILQYEGHRFKLKIEYYGTNWQQFDGHRNLYPIGKPVRFELTAIGKFEKAPDEGSEIDSNGRFWGSLCIHYDTYDAVHQIYLKIIERLEATEELGPLAMPELTSIFRWNKPS